MAVLVTVLGLYNAKTNSKEKHIVIGQIHHMEIHLKAVREPGKHSAEMAGTVKDPWIRMWREIRWMMLMIQNLARQMLSV